MDIIKEYILNRFATLPENDENNKLRDTILKESELKYNELRLDGKSENEATYTIILELNNFENYIDCDTIDIPEESLSFSKCGISMVDENQLTVDDAKIYLKVRRTAGRLIATGVAFCILGASVFIALFQYMKDNFFNVSLSENAIESISLIFLFLFIVPAIGMFLYGGIKMDRYNYIEKRKFSLLSETSFYIKNVYKDFQSKFFWRLIIGICTSATSVIIIFIGASLGQRNEVYSISILLLLIAVSIWIIVDVSIYNGTLVELLKIDYYENDKVLRFLSYIYWFSVVGIYLISSYTTSNWDKLWVIFPIACIIFFIFKNVYSLIRERNNKSK